LTARECSQKGWSICNPPVANPVGEDFVAGMPGPAGICPTKRHLSRMLRCITFSGRMSEMGLGRVKTKSDLVVTPSEACIFAFFCSQRDRKPQNSGCDYTAQSFRTA
jgi:hypothetical protein